MQSYINFSNRKKIMKPNKWLGLFSIVILSIHYLNTAREYVDGVRESG